MHSIDDALVNFKKFRANVSQYIEQDLSETDTRSKVIDLLMCEVLGWNESDIQREGHSDAGYYDYKISVPGFSFVVEAKKQFAAFFLPKNHSKSSIKAIYGENKETIDQIRGYAIENGIQYGIITNGSQFVFLKLLNTDSKPWKGNQCILFNSLDDVEERFVQFYDNFSKHGIVSVGGFKYDLPVNVIQSKTILSTLVDRDKELVRNPLSSKIAPIINRIFGEIFSEEDEDDADFIEQCFVKNEETKKNRNEIERLFADRAPEIERVVPAVNNESIVRQIQDEIEEDDVSIRNLAPPGPIVIIGTKGAGKTTFINHLFKVVFADEIEHHLTVYLDLRKYFDRNSEFQKSIIAQEILNLLYDQYPEFHLHSLPVLVRIYYKQIKRHDEGTWAFDKNNNPQEYNAKLTTFLEESQHNVLGHLEYLSRYLIRERQKRLIVIIDNADQFEISIQAEVFLFAHALAKSVLCGTVISLREGYYYKWRLTPPFDAYESNVYHITAPRYGDVLQKRIDFTLNKIKLDTDATLGTGSTKEITNQAIIEFLSGLRTSLFSDENGALLDFLNFTTYPNIREGLKVFKSFLISGHTNVHDYIQRQRFRLTETNVPIIPVHEFVKSIGLQNKHYYSSEISPVHNLFTPPADSDDHFVKIYIIQDLSRLQETSGRDKVTSDHELFQKFTAFGYRSNIVASCLRDLVTTGMIDTDNQIADTKWEAIPTGSNFRVTAKGYFYLRNLIGRFYYLDLVLQDTPIFDSQYFDELQSRFPKSDELGKRFLRDRVETVKVFVDYLSDREATQSRQVSTAYGSVVRTIRDTFERDVIEVEKALDIDL